MVKKATINRRVNLYEKMYKEGISLSQIEKMSVGEFKKQFDVKRSIKKSSVEGRIRLAKQVASNKSQVLQAYFKKNNIQNKRVIKHHKTEFDQLYILKKAQRKTEKQKQQQLIDSEVQKAKSLTKRKGVYHLSKVLATEYDSVSQQSFEREFFIRYNNADDLQKQIQNILQSYNVSIFDIAYIGTYSYQDNLTQEFKNLVQERLPN
jgi:hypothetical protein